MMINVDECQVHWLFLDYLVVVVVVVIVSLFVDDDGPLTKPHKLSWAISKLNMDKKMNISITIKDISDHRYDNALLQPFYCLYVEFYVTVNVFSIPKSKS